MSRLALDLTEDSFKIPVTPEREGRDIRVIEALPGKVLTGSSAVPPKIVEGAVESDLERDILKTVVIEKNQGTGRIAVGFTAGFGLKRGALASSVAHDAHNYIAIGLDDLSIRTAMKYLIDNNGGLVATDGVNIVESLSLPIGGLMSNFDPPSLSRALLKMIKASEEMGSTIPQPYMVLSFLSLSVIPDLKLTDRGYVNLMEGGLLDLFI